MDPTRRAPQPLELVPIDEPAAKTEPAEQPPAAAVSEPAVVDKFVVDAAREFEQGLIHEPLWKRVVAAAGDDKNSAKTAYVRARAAELRAGRAQPLAKRGPPKRSEPERKEAERRPSKTVASPIARFGASLNAMSVRTRIGVAAALGSLVVAALAVAALRHPDAGPETTAAKTQPSAAATIAPRPKTPPAPATSNPAPDEDGTQQLIAKLRELREAGNWNVHVLYANEWTRKEPSNAAAWHELAAGYANLHQMAEAGDAASKAAQLSPQDAGLWRNLAEIKLAADDEDAALKAFRRASELDPQDARSAVQVGVLHARLNHFDDARSALDAALVLAPGNADALCAQIDVAQKQQRAKDAEAFAKDLAAAGGTCPEPKRVVAAEAVPVKPATNARAAPARPPAPAPKR